MCFLRRRLTRLIVSRPRFGMLEVLIAFSTDALRLRAEFPGSCLCSFRWRWRTHCRELLDRSRSFQLVIDVVFVCLRLCNMSGDVCDSGPNRKHRCRITLCWVLNATSINFPMVSELLVVDVWMCILSGGDCGAGLSRKHGLGGGPYGTFAVQRTRVWVRLLFCLQILVHRAHLGAVEWSIVMSLFVLLVRVFVFWFIPFGLLLNLRFLPSSHNVVLASLVGK